MGAVWRAHDTKLDREVAIKLLLDRTLVDDSALSGARFGRELKSGDCGGIYGKHAPALDACRPAGEWQSYDIQFSSPRHEDGEKVANARMTVWHNGLRIHDDVEIDGPTTAAMSADEPGRGPILLQDHGHAVRYRNVWLSPR